MSYHKVITYKVLPEQSYKIIRNCSGCGCKQKYISTGEFRVNANGNRIDVWLIYQCEKCKHTYNLPIYERVRPAEIKTEYEKFLANDQTLAFQYGNDKALFARNRAEVSLDEVSYRMVQVKNERSQQTDEQAAFRQGDCICLENPYGLKIRTDKIMAEILNCSRSKIKQLMDEGIIEMGRNYLDRMSKVNLHGEIV